jgi:hypothetical protein
MLHTFRNSEPLTVLLTLTYPGDFPTDGRRVKRHWHNFRTWLVRGGKERPSRKGAWFLEFQGRGAPHFHIFLDGPVDKKEVARKWYDLVASGDERHLRAGTRIETLREGHAAAAYASKYASKAEQKEVPDGFSEVGRFWGTFGDLDVGPLLELATAEQLALDPVTGEVQPDRVVQAVRVCRGAYNARRRSRGRPKMVDNGRAGFTAYDVGGVLREYLERVP